MRIILFLTFVFVAHLTQSQTPKYSNEFVRVGLGADALGKAGAVVSTIDNVSAGYWNPAALIEIQSSYEIASMHAEYFAGMAKYDYLGASYRLDSFSVVAVNVIRFGVDDIQNTLDLFDTDGNIDYSRIKKFSVADYAVLLSYARNIWKNGFSVGGNIKVIRRVQGEFASAWGFGLDVALRYQTQKWQFGAVIRDISTTVNTWSFNEDALNGSMDGVDLGNTIPEDNMEITLPSVTLGVSRTFRFKEYWTANIALDADLFLDGQRNTLLSSEVMSADLKLGSEIGYRHMVFLRLGVADFQQEKEFDNTEKLRMSPFMGLGINYKGFSIDYALGNIANVGGGRFSNYFSLRYAFGA